MDDGTSKYAIERPEPAGGAAGPMSGPMKANLLERFLRIGSDIAVVHFIVQTRKTSNLERVVANYVRKPSTHFTPASLSTFIYECSAAPLRIMHNFTNRQSGSQ